MTIYGSALSRAVLNFDEVKSINRRIQILKSMYYECRLTARLLKSKAKDLDELVGESVA